MCPREEVTVSEWTDRVYLGPSSSPVELVGVGGDNTTLQLTTTNLPDTVIWNPWQEKVPVITTVHSFEACGWLQPLGM